MKKVLAIVSAVIILAAISTSCNKTGCHCYLKTDVTHAMPVYEDNDMSKADCQAKEDELNQEMGNMVSCNQ